jgi:hypothetical protein
MDVLTQETKPETDDVLLKAEAVVEATEEFENCDEIGPPQPVANEVIVTATVAVQEVAEPGAQNANMADAMSPDLKFIFQRFG